MNFDFEKTLKRIEEDPASVRSAILQKKIFDDAEAADAEFLAELTKKKQVSEKGIDNAKV